MNLTATVAKLRREAAPLFVTLLLIAAGAPETASAQVTTDGTLGPARTLNGSFVFVNRNLGAQRGANLFHSFGLFNVATNELVQFDAAPGTQNIIARVTGSQLSRIDGQVYSPANLFLLNPRGVVLGAGATLDVAGSLTLSTADYIRFANGERFYASPGSASVLSVAPPRAFGFLDASAGAITTDSALLQVATGQSLALIGGALTLTNSQLSVDAGRLDLAAVAAAGEVLLAPNALDTGAISTFANIHFDGTLVNAFGEEAGNVYIRGGEFVMTGNSAIIAEAATTAPARRIDIDVGSLSLSSSGILTGATANGVAPSLSIDAQALSLANVSGITSTNDGTMSGGSIDVRAGTVSVTGDGTPAGLSLLGTGTVGGTGNAGNLTIRADSVTLAGGSLSALTASAGDAGTIDIIADRVLLSGGGNITTGTTASGNGGRIAIVANELDIDGAGPAVLPAGISVTTNSIGNDAGDAGAITIEVDRLRLNRGNLSSSTAGPGNGGTIAIAADTATLADASRITSETGVIGAFGPASSYGASGRIDLDVGTLAIDSNSVVSTSTAGNGSAGQLTIRGDTVTVSGGATIAAATLSTAAQAGDAADIVIDTASLTLRDGAQITNASSGRGRGGRLAITSDDISVASGARIQVSSLGTAATSGSVGDIDIASDVLTLDAASIQASSAGSVTAGHIAIDARSVALDHGAVVSAVGNGTGAAGSIEVAGETITLARGAQLTSDTNGSGAGGRIAVTADRLTINGTDSTALTGISVASNSSDVGAGAAGTIAIDAGTVLATNGRVSSSTNGPGRGGAIRIDAQSLTLGRNASITSETGSGTAAAYGAGGAITLDADTVRVLSGSRVSAATFANGAGGAVTITAQRLTIDGATAAGAVIPTVVSASTGAAFAPGASGAGGNLAINAQRIELANLGMITANTFGSGRAGRVDVRGTDVSLSNNAAISAASFSTAANAGAANSILVQAARLDVGGSSQITNATSGPGSAGQLAIDAPTVNLTDNALLQVSSLGAGTATGAVGDLFVNSNALTIAGASIAARSASAAVPGNIFITTGTLTLRDAATITAVGTGSGSAGNIVAVAAGSIVLDGFSQITTEARAAAGGNITLVAQDRLTLTDSLVSTSVTGGNANGGNIRIDPQFVILDNGHLIARAVGGNGGNIDIATQFLVRSGSSTIDAASAFGLDGDIELTGTNVDLDSDVVSLPADFLDVRGWLTRACANRSNARVSTFTVRGRDGAYTSAGDLAASPLLLEEGTTGRLADWPETRNAAAPSFAVPLVVLAGACAPAVGKSW